MTYEETAAIVMVVMGAYPQMQNKEMGPTAEAWHAVLGHLNEETARLAACEVLDTSDYFPAPSLVLARAREIIRDQQPKLKALPSPEKSVTPEALSLMKKAGEMVAMGTAKTYLRAMDISRELAFAKTLFPNITEERVRHNYVLFNEIMHEHAICNLCGSMEGCPYSGYRMELEMTSAGYVRELRAQCKNNHRQSRNADPDSFRNKNWGKKRA